MLLKGYAKKDIKTKNLIRTLGTGDIPIIVHKDLDEVAACSFIEKKVKIVINCEKSISGRYPTKGAYLLIKSGVILIDCIGLDFYKNINQGDLIEIKEDCLFINGKKYMEKFNLLNEEKVMKLLEKGYKNFPVELERFVNNTIEYANKEKKIVLKEIDVSFIKTRMKNRPVLIVVRGCNYKEDLFAIREYIRDFKPVLIGVDGGGDALMEFGLIPDLIVGDMDSISDLCLRKGREIIVHAYQDGSAPGMKKINELGLKAQTFSFPGTSEDVAMIIAYEKKADIIIAVGTHSNIIDFLEKGRKGMGSTILTRLKIGDKLIDAKGVSKLYSNKLDSERVGLSVLNNFDALDEKAVLLKNRKDIQKEFN